MYKLTLHLTYRHITLMACDAIANIYIGGRGKAQPKVTFVPPSLREAVNEILSCISSK